MQRNTEKELVKVSDVLREIEAEIQRLRKTIKDPFMITKSASVAGAKVNALAYLKTMIEKCPRNSDGTPAVTLSQIIQQWEERYGKFVDQHRNPENDNTQSPTTTREFVNNFVGNIRSKYIRNDVIVTADLQKKLAVLLKIKNDPKLNSENMKIKTKQAKMIAGAIGQLSTDEIYKLAIKLMQDHNTNHPNLAMMRSDATIGDSSRLIKDLYNALAERLQYNAYDENKNNPVDPRLNVLHWFVNASVSKNLNKEDPVQAVSTVIFNAENERRTNKLDYTNAGDDILAQARIIELERTSARRNQSLIGKIVNDAVKSEVCPVSIIVQPIPNKASVKQRILSTKDIFAATMKDRLSRIKAAVENKVRGKSGNMDIYQEPPLPISPKEEPAKEKSAQVTSANPDDGITKYENEMQKIHALFDELPGIANKEEKISRLDACLKELERFDLDTLIGDTKDKKIIKDIYAKHGLDVKYGVGVKVKWSEDKMEYAKQIKKYDAIPEDEKNQISQAERRINAVFGLDDLKQEVKLLRDDLKWVIKSPGSLQARFQGIHEGNSEFVERLMLNCDKQEVIQALSKCDIKVVKKLAEMLDHPKVLDLIFSDPRMQKIKAGQAADRGIEVQRIGKSATVDNAFFDRRPDDWRQREDKKALQDDAENNKLKK